MIRATMSNQDRLLYALILTLAMLACGMLSMWFGKELGWDLANYHYYQPYAILHDRMQIDFWPSSFIHQYINPAIDFLPYYLINHVSPRMTEFLLGAIHGINFWLLFIIANLFISSRSLCLIVALLGMYAPSALSGIGSFQNDDLVSIFVLAFVFLYIRGLASENDAIYKYFLFASLLLGIGIGLKLTAGIFALGAIFATMLLPISFRQRMTLLLLTSIAITVGVFLSSGYWMALMWEQHHNPFFPFLNNLFHSADFASVNWRDTRFLPHGIWENLFFPFYFSWDGRTADGFFRDFRFAILYVLFVLAGINWLVKKRPRDLMLTWLLAFFVFSYLIWQYYFSIARYLTPLEMLSPLIIYLLLKQLPIPHYVHATAIVIIFYTLFFFMSPIPVARARWYDTTFFNIKLPPVVQETHEAVVLVAYSVYMQGKPWLDVNPRPQAYLIPFFPPHWRFIGIPFGHGKYLADQTLEQKIYSITNIRAQRIFLLTSNVDMPELYRVAASFGLIQAGSCEKIYSDRQKMTDQDVLLCPVRR